MDEIGTVERIYCFDKAALLRSVLLSIGLPSVVMFGLAQLRPKYREAFPVAAPIVAIVLAYAQWPAIRAAVTGRGAVVITDRGLQNSTGGVTFVAWNEIRTARIASYLGMKRIELELRYLEPVIERMGPLRGWLLKRYVTKYRGKPSIYVHLAEANADELLTIINNRTHASSHAV